MVFLLVPHFSLFRKTRLLKPHEKEYRPHDWGPGIGEFAETYF